MAGSLPNPVVGEPNSSADPKTLALLKLFNELLNGENKIPTSSLAQSKLTWYTPSVVATEQTRESTAYGTLATADEVVNVVLPENGFMLVGFSAAIKSSVIESGKVALFLGANQLKVDGGGTAPVVQETSTAGTAQFRHCTSSIFGLKMSAASGVWTGDVTTGQVVSGEQAGGFIHIKAAAGTYNVSVRYKAGSGNVSAKERQLWVAVIG